MLNPDFSDILSAFNAERVEYRVVGAYALAAHGLPRATGHIDLWIDATAENAARVWRALTSFGAPLQDIPREDLSSPDVVIQLGIAPRRIDLLTSIDGVDFENAWAERARVEIDDLEVTVISRRHLIANKRATGRPQDLADVARLEGDG